MTPAPTRTIFLAVSQWHGDLATWHWRRGEIDLYLRHITIRDALLLRALHTPRLKLAA